MNAIQTSKNAPQPANGVGALSKMIALMRLMLAVSGLLIFALNPSIYSSPAESSYDTLTLYGAYAYCVYAALHCLFPNTMLRIMLLPWLHWIDLLWYVVLIALSGGLDSPFLPFLFFAILVASFRYGAAEGVKVTVACVLFSILILFFPLTPEMQDPLYPSLVRAVTLLILGYLIACWGGLEALQTRQLRLLSEINRIPDPHLSAEEAMGESLEHIRKFYAAHACLAVMKMPDAGYVIFKVERDPEKTKMLGQPLDQGIAAHLLALPPQCSISYASNAEWYFSSATTYEPSEWSLRTESQYGEAIAQFLEAETFASVPLRLHGEDIGRIYLTSCRENLDSSDITFLQQVVNQITPYIENIHLLDKVAAAASVTMRQQISLDLHDTTIQPYIGLKLGLEALRRKITDNDAIASEVDDLVRMTGEGIAELRHYIGGLKARLEEPLLPALMHVAEKYQYNYGIKVAVNVSPDLKINDRLAAEIYQIVSEAMSNIRRHTNASQATINLSYQAGQLVIEVINHSDSTQAFTIFKPRSISERVTHLGGTVTVDHHADGSTVVTATIPLKVKERLHAKYE